MRDEVEAEVRSIIEGLAGGPDGDDPEVDDPDVDDPDVDDPSEADARRIGDLYSSFADADTVEALGVGPLKPLLEEIDDATDHRALAEILGARQRDGLAGLFWIWVGPDARDSTRYLPHLAQAGLGLPDEAYYREADHADALEGYRRHLGRIAELAGLPDPRGKADAALALESELADCSSDAVSARDADKSYTLLDWAQLCEQASGFDWTSWLKGFRAPPAGLEHIVVGQPDFATATARLWSERPLEQWKAWLTLRVVSSCATYLGTDLVDADFDFYGRTLSGTPELQQRWRRGVALVEAVLGDAVGRLYVERHFPASSRDRVVGLVDKLTEAYRRSFTELDWMSEATRGRAMEKLDRFTAKIGYPDRWKDYEGLEIRADDLLGNVVRADRWRTGREMDKIGRPVDRAEWLTTPQTVNAFYNPRLNEVVFPAAVLRPPLFDPDADDAANYGGIGATIGHEIGHGFDDQGSKYDGDGNLVDWWEPADRDRFTALTQALIDQYDGLAPAGLSSEHTVNGELTVGENIGDLGGLAIALEAYRLAVTHSGASEPPVLDGLTGTQRVLFAWAQTWRAVTREAETIRRLATDPHAPPDLRCNAVVTNLDSFHEAFDVNEGDALFTPEADRVRIW